MQLFETILALLAGAIVLSAAARRLRIPYPALLALGGAVIAVLPSAPRLDVDPQLVLALFVAPILMDAAYDASVRDLRRHWIPVISLVLVAVAVTTVAVAWTARLVIPDMPWAAAVALGALVAPPDAVAALAVLRQVAPPHHIRVVLEGESLLNDATSLLIYRLAVGAVAAGSFSVVETIPTFALVSVGSVVAGLAAAWPVGLVALRIDDASMAVLFQFVATFGLWIAAEHFGLSAVIAIVVFGVTLAQRRAFRLKAHMRVPSFAIWETATVVLNVLAFTLVGLQLRPILEGLEPGQRWTYGLGAVLILVVVIVVRLAWVLTHHGLAVLRSRLPAVDDDDRSGAMPTVKDALVVGWSGMRGVVTLAAALALPADFPNRDFIQFTAFIVVLGTLLLQGVTLRLVIRWLGLPPDRVVADEVAMARGKMLEAALASLGRETSPVARRLRDEYEDARGRLASDEDETEDDEPALRSRAVEAGRRVLDSLRDSNAIGDDAYREAEEELDWLELSVRTTDTR